MGGSGSGRRWHWNAKRTTGQHHVLDVRELARKGAFSSMRGTGPWSRKSFTITWNGSDGEPCAWIGGYIEESSLVLKYTVTDRNGESEDMEYDVDIDWTRCNLGGERPWFLCPAAGCGRRVAILYMGRIFACRHCCDLAYESQREPPDLRLHRQANKIRARLGWKPGIFNPTGWKPKGMHWRTYSRLTHRHHYFAQRSLAIMAARLGLRI
jgi:hypothetical protein